MRKLLALILISKLAWAQTAKLDTNTILIGEQTTFSISHALGSDYEIKWPTYNDTIVSGIEIINASSIDTLQVHDSEFPIIKQDFIITAWDSGSYYIPPIYFSEDIKTEGFLLNVKTLILEENAELKDIKQPIEEPIGWSDIWPWLLGLLIIGLIIYLLKKYVFNKKDEVAIQKPKVVIPVDVVALEQLNKLEEEKLWQEGEIKDYHSQLSEIIRRYTEERFKFIALELTTDEILDELKNKLNSNQLADLNTLLQRADLVKFAKSKPIDSDNIESMLLAKNFVNQTKEQIENE